ncbi:cyclase-like protein 2 [Mercurialis annua]|uniref:cyclase-like protein 2 n=1 Tax=Mercurialis annua TaxID=3986 RepID=UPI00215E228D|nr:cyclase-like protein 2 [Mercurialis annua]
MAKLMSIVQILLLLQLCNIVLTLAGRRVSDISGPVRREVYDNGKIYDITHRVNPDMPSWDSKNGVGEYIKLVNSMKNGSLFNDSELKFNTHTGTHIDAPSHFYEKYYDAGFDTDTVDLRILNGPALLVDVPRDSNITAKVMQSLKIPKGVTRVLFRTLNSDRKLMFKKEFDSSYTGFMSDGAKWLVENTDIRLVGVDYLSVASYVDILPTHLVFLKNREVTPVEALKLDGVKAGVYDLHCLPMRVLGADGSPTRCILIE